MLLGQSPFRGDDEDEIFDAILEDEPLYPITMPRDAVSILQKVSLRRYFDAYLFTCALAVDSGSYSPPWLKQRRCRRAQAATVLQGCQFR